MIQLHSYPNACSMSVHITLQWAGADYEYIKADFSDEYKKINPSGLVPALIDSDHDKTMVQNHALLIYIGQKYPEAKLLGDESIMQMYEINRALAIVGGDLHPAFGPIFHADRFSTITGEQSMQGIMQASFLRIDTVMTQLDNYFLDHKYFAGDSKTVADAYLFTILRWSFNIPKTLKEYPNLNTYFEMMSEDEGIKKVLAVNNPE